jgi:hypothetical protein
MYRGMRCPNIMMVLGTILAYVNAFPAWGVGDVWGAGTLISGWGRRHSWYPSSCSATT